MAEPLDLRVVGDRIEELLDRLEADLDARAWDQVQDVVSLVTELYGGGLARVLELVADAATRDRLAGDDLVGSLLILHDLHPVPLEERVERAMASVRPYFDSHGGDMEVLDIDAEEGVVTLKLLGTCDGCSSSSATLELAVRRAIEEVAPEIVRIDVAGADDPEPAGSGSSIPVTLGRKPQPVAP